MSIFIILSHLERELQEETLYIKQLTEQFKRLSDSTSINIYKKKKGNFIWHIFNVWNILPIFLNQSSS